MRVAKLVGSFAAMFVAASAMAADRPPDVRTVVSPQAQLWCGPSTSDGLYPTNLLRQGDRVQVVEELPSGWLAVRPPTGSFSWINTRFLMLPSSNHTNYAVAYEGYPVPVLIGSSVKTERPTKIGVKLPRGAQVRGIGRTRTDDEGVWLPIDPPEGEVRYIRKEAVANSTSPIRTTVAAAGSPLPAPSTPPPPPDGDALWRDAEKAERTGRLADAIRLYRLAGDANLAVNRARADEAYRRAHWLQQANSGTNAPSGSYYIPERDSRAVQQPAARGSTAVRPIGPAGRGSPTGQLVSTQAAPSWGSPQTSSSPATASGRLRLSSHRGFQNQRLYLLISPSDVPLMYVIAGPGVDLTSYIDRNVELWGSTSYYHGDLRAHLLTATQARELP